MIGKLVPVLVPVFLDEGDGEVFGRYELIHGSPTATLGLLITPELSTFDGDFTGRFQITHALTGLRVGPAYEMPDQAQKMAAALRDVGAAWERREPIRPGDDVLVRRIQDILGVRGFPLQQDGVAA